MIQNNFYYCPIMGLKYESLQVDYNGKKVSASYIEVDLSKTPIRRARGRIFKTQHKR